MALDATEKAICPVQLQLPFIMCILNIDHIKRNTAMRSYSVAEAKDHFQEMLDHVRAGETVALTEDGKTLAELHPKEVDRKALVAHLGKEFAAIREKVKPATRDEIMEWRRSGLK